MPTFTVKQATKALEFAIEFLRDLEANSMTREISPEYVVSTIFSCPDIVKPKSWEELYNLHQYAYMTYVSHCKEFAEKGNKIAEKEKTLNKEAKIPKKRGRPPKKVDRG